MCHFEMLIPYEGVGHPVHCVLHPVHGGGLRAHLAVALRRPLVQVSLGDVPLADLREGPLSFFR